MNEKLVRLHKAIAEMGYCSRRKAEDLIERGEVRVNGKVVKEQGLLVNPQRDRINVAGQTLQEHRKVYLAMYKPIGVICTREDSEKRPTIYSIVKEKRRLFSVGRLDVDSEGLLLLTNDGELAHRLTHPSYGVVKEYEVKIQKGLTDDQLFRLSEGIDLEGRKTNPCSIELMHRTETNAWYQFIINEGRNRQIRRMVEEVGGFVMKLRRVSFAGIQLGSMKESDVRALSAREVFDLQNMVGLDPMEKDEVDWDPLSSAVMAYEGDDYLPQRPARPSPARPASRPERTEQRPRFDRDKPERPSSERFTKSERPRFDRDKPERPSSERFTKSERPRFDRDKPERPSSERFTKSERPRFDRDKPERPSSERFAKSERPRFDREKPERPSSERFAKGERPRFDRDKPERPSSERFAKSERPRFDRDKPERPSSERFTKSERPRFDRDKPERPSSERFAKSERPRFDRDKPERPSSERFTKSERPRFDRDKPERPSSERFTQSERPRFDREKPERGKPEHAKPSFTKKDERKLPDKGHGKGKEKRSEKESWNDDDVMTKGDFKALLGGSPKKRRAKSQD